ncbi:MULTISPECIES: 5-(carboxyamino)imidazole ribonucleotide synthase [Pseudomonas]|jgi:5-(carboxyamino)imidazole ribonucleotide synthase|uniref:5-(carboxyamino)imidazole ribonucleotide synthase n=1 Tax=Pseudomonas TaxID=286 RepID=UPI0002A362CA|nr:MULTISPECIES: 5-(carboxyamino)imidazole ribonucleotide synthase [Pseudomonas]AMO79476.1 N5-carboxyaminoimidazole ribonucleotide synthase [Pseudomonas citronellolis]KES23481.1 phosphoribosylaminoimidazole carboxylase [Pseudomonas sp. AAC]KWR76910.1 5-(carboxyamino)imidazole ribonucleotide synthase [Pseudomonas sp. PI1]MBB1610502.1 5-(carboxyamino)imidazole ribonucleotide synthase [Pseudomonas sp. UMC76]MBB1636730.1 5-(carboxyamino)imidazole ribonucleotide synthase [Pseudomonas sp. UME83]
MKIGVIGGGQLGRMLSLAGTPLGMDFAFLDPAPDACAQALGEHIRADYSDQDHLRQLADEVDLVTFEFESVPAETVAFLSQFVPVYPSASALRIARDRWFEKSMFKDLGIPTPAFADIQSQADLDAAAAGIGLPAVLKTRTLGYDGKGQKVLRKPEDVAGAFAELGSVPCILEGFVPFTGEVSLVAVRARDGETRFYPLVHNTHENGILRLSVASSEHPLQALAEDYVGRVLDKLDYVGVLAFEFFEVDGGLKANEIAPRVHNSGHWTIEGSECSQFENHLRAVAGLPLGSTAKVGESAMLNFIGEVPPVEKVLAIADCHLHHYGKAFKAGRKVGHATLRSKDLATLKARIGEVEALIGKG